MAYKWWWSNGSLPAAIVTALLSVQLVQAGNTACVSNQLSWYTDVVGESPCMTYQRLRQICNNDYQVPTFSTTVPGDRCDDQVSECCCNMVAFQLSMLCMVCQQDKQDSGGIGIDAPGKGTYTVYRGTCGAGANHTLPGDLQSAVCNKNIRIDNFLYDSWDDGTWFYVWTKENVERLHAANNNNTFTHCPDQISPSPTPTTTSSTSSTTVQQAQPTPAPTTGVSSIATPVTSPMSTSTTTSEVSSISNSPFAFNTSVQKSLETIAPTSGASGAPSASSSPSPSLGALGAQPSDPGSGDDGQSKSKPHVSLIGGVVGGVLGLVLLVLTGIVWRRRKTGNDKHKLRSAHGDDFGYKSAPTDPLVSAPADPLAPNRRRGTERRQTPPAIAYDDDPFSSGASPRTSGMGSSSAFSPQPPATLTETALRHHDGGAFTTAGLTRSDSGRLPPAYEDWWDSDRSGRRTTDPSAGLASGPVSSFQSEDVSGSRTTTTTTTTAADATAYGSAALDDTAFVRPRALPTLGLAGGATRSAPDSDSKDPSLFI